MVDCGNFESGHDWATSKCPLQVGAAGRQRPHRHMLPPTATRCGMSLECSRRALNQALRSMTAWLFSRLRTPRSMISGTVCALPCAPTAALDSLS